VRSPIRSCRARPRDEQHSADKGDRVSTAGLAFLGVLVGAGIAAITSVITALLTAKLAERRETRARLFDARRVTYAEAIRATGIARHSILEPIVGDLVWTFSELASSWPSWSCWARRGCTAHTASW
jgi:hypothetical protein